MSFIQIAVLVITFLASPAWLSAENKSEATPKETEHITIIKEVKKGDKYLYLRLDENGEEIWIATSPSFIGGIVKEGDSVMYTGGVKMENFKSKELDRTFDSILFITKIKKMDAVQLKSFDYVPGDNVHKKFVEQSQDLPAPDAGEIKKPEAGKSIEEIFAALAELKDKEVTVRGRVMKVSKQILKKNWITIQDGTGSLPDNKLVVTTQETAGIGDVVTYKGLVRTDIDLGSGYKYRVLLEEAVSVK